MKISKKIIVLIYLYLIVGFKVSAQEEVVSSLNSDSVPANSEFISNNENPKFEGKDINAFIQWVNSEIIYPESALRDNIQGRVVLRFTVDTAGNVTNVHVLKGVSKELDEEAVRVISSSPKWIPNYENGKPVAVSYNFPLTYSLPDDYKYEDLLETDSIPTKSAVELLAERLFEYRNGSKDIDVHPKFRGKDRNTFNYWVNSRIRYPESALKNNIQGQVLLSFTIDSVGNVTNVYVVRGVSKELDKEAVRVISSSPKWTPGYKDGKPISVFYHFPVNFSNPYIDF